MGVRACCDARVEAAADLSCGRPDLFLGCGGELEGPDRQLREYGRRELAMRILGRRRVLRLPQDRAELDALVASRTAR